MPTDDEILTVDNSADLDETMDRIKSWVYLEEGPNFQKLVELKRKYGHFYDYVHHLKPEAIESKVYLMNPRANYKLEYSEEGIRYRLISAEDLHTNMTVWLKKDYVVMGVR